MLNIIHLPERDDRLEQLQKELDAQNISEYKICPGVKSTFAFNGIREAHQNIVREAHYNNEPYVIIAEDDIKFLDNGAYDYYLKNMPPLDDFDIYLGGIMNGEIMEDNSLVDGYFTGLTLYTVNKRFYSQFISIRQSGHIDALLRGHGRYIVCNPMVVSQHGGWSDSAGKIVKSYDDYIKGRNLYKKQTPDP